MCKKTDELAHRGGPKAQLLSAGKPFAVEIAIYESPKKLGQNPFSWLLIK
jgi:hypothetical protein